MTRPYRRKVTKLNMENEPLKTYESIKLAAEEHYISPVAISRVLSGTRITAAGYYWIYADGE